MIYIITTEYGQTREHQQHEVTRRTAYLRSMGIAYTVTKGS